MTGAILAGGRSRRMQGPDKARMLRDGAPVLARLAKLLAQACDDVALVAREDQLEAMRAFGVGDVYADLFPNLGPLGGLYTALEETEDDVFLVACDLPFLEATLIARILGAWRAAPEGFALLPRTKTEAGEWQPEPLCAVWSRHCRRPAYVALEAQELSLTAFGRSVNALYLDLSAAEAHQLRNVNRPEDLEPGIGFG